MDTMKRIQNEFDHVTAVWCDGYYANMLPLYPIQHGEWMLIRRIGLVRVDINPRTSFRRITRWEDCGIESKLRFVQTDEPGFIETVCRVTRERLDEINTTLDRWKISKNAT